MIRIEHLNKAYNAPVLRDVTLHVHEGESLGIIGQSGSGKSTLARLLLGLEEPDSGTITIDGLPLKTWQRQHPGRCTAVFQDYANALNPMLPIWRSLEEPLEALRLPRDRHAIEALLASVELPAHLTRAYPHELSGGMLQRVCLARALASQPKILVLDEALSALDVSIQAQMLTLLSSLKNTREMTTIFIAHDLYATLALCNRLAFVQEGSIVSHCKTCDVHEHTHPYVKELFHAHLLS
ncbi:MAG: ATP-binding cassette domain-containing protein [Campylobacterales bacterium]|nr:ATP-binding cassette domain-containing protein [Campylobacterales bacterium]